MRRLDCHDAIKRVQSRYQTAQQTVDVLIGIVTGEPKYLYTNNLALPNLRTLSRELHDIYFTRMFASFESSLRHYWRSQVKKTKPLTHHLLASIAARRGIPQDTLDIVHEIRDFRNFLIHEEHEIKREFTIEQASGPLNTYLARLPLEW